VGSDKHCLFSLSYSGMCTQISQKIGMIFYPIYFDMLGIEDTVVWEEIFFKLIQQEEGLAKNDRFF